MLICNLINESYKQLRKEQFGLCTNYDILYSLFNQELGLYLECTGVVLCYTPETCVGTTTVTCTLVTSQTITPLSCSLVAVQSFDDP